MSLEEYFGDWLKVIDKKILYETINILNTTDFSTLCPIYNNIFNDGYRVLLNLYLYIQ